MKGPTKATTRTVADLALAAVLGLGAMIGAGVLRGVVALPNLSDAPAVAWKRASLLSFILLFGAGIVAGTIAKRPFARFVGLGCLGVYPLLAIEEMIRDPTSHNLWPIEFAFYGVFSLVPLAGSMAANYLRSMRSATH